MAHVTYQCSQAISDSMRSLIDGGANGRLTSADVCTLTCNMYWECTHDPRLLESSNMSYMFKNRGTEIVQEWGILEMEEYHLPFSGQQKDWDEWSEKYQGIAAERGYLTVRLGNEDVPTDALDIDQKVENKYLIPDEDDRKQKHLTRKRNQKGCRDLQLSMSKLAFQLVSLAKTTEFLNGSVAKAWASLKDEYDPSEGEDKIRLLEYFQSNKLLNVKVNITEWQASLAVQVMKLNKLKHPINDDYLMTHLLASLPQEYSSAVDHAKIDWRTKTLMLT